MPHPFTSVAGELEQAKEQVALNVIDEAARFLRTNGQKALADQWLAENWLPDNPENKVGGG